MTCWDNTHENCRSHPIIWCSDTEPLHKEGGRLTPVSALLNMLNAFLMSSISFACLIKVVSFTTRVITSALQNLEGRLGKIEEYEGEYEIGYSLQ